ncbi:hypothetical protein ACHAW5_009599 [Stephanodiscus triporus]|uniref:Methyltransferase type 11 domain-containing protein n=1 Tax=Stephanodiscus triporus TaxID=2934178 RepID=A0ABD3ML62_9STRA
MPTDIKRKAHSGASNSPGKGGAETEDENLKDLLNNKRQKGEEDSGGIVGDAESRSPSASKKRPAPKYGSKEYWNARYKSHVTGARECAQLEKDCTADVNGDGYVLDGVLLSKEAIEPGHEWYFSYDELRPLIMPLILGSMDKEVVESDYDEDEDAESWVEEEDKGDNGEMEEEDGDNDSIITENYREGTRVAVQSKCEEKSDNPSIVIDQPSTLTLGDYSNDNELPGELDLTKRKPKRILEVGCGDKPLGSSLASDLISMQTDMGIDAQLLVGEVTCIDYSDIVVQRLNKQRLDGEESHPSNNYASTLKKSETLQPTFQVMDARSLPFLSNTYDLILEKGTLDAMLSDEEEGLSNCIKIVKEMARVTSEGGSILIVSHLNANEPKGMAWLQDVVFRGLKDDFVERRQFYRERRKATQAKLSDDKKKAETSENDNSKDEDDEKEYVWSVEVHGGDGQYLDENGDEIEDVDEDVIPIYGPAVYIVKKRSVPASIAKELFGKKRERRSAEDVKDSEHEEEGELVEMPPVKLTYMTYGGD